MHVRVCTKDDIFRQRRLNHSGVGGRKIAFRRVYPARAYTTFVVLVRITCAEAYWSTLVRLALEDWDEAITKNLNFERKLLILIVLSFSKNRLQQKHYHLLQPL